MDRTCITIGQDHLVTGSEVNVILLLADHLTSYLVHDLGVQVSPRLLVLDVANILNVALLDLTVLVTVIDHIVGLVIVDGRIHVIIQPTAVQLAFRHEYRILRIAIHHGLHNGAHILVNVAVYVLHAPLHLVIDTVVHVGDIVVVGHGGVRVVKNRLSLILAQSLCRIHIKQEHIYIVNIPVLLEAMYRLVELRLLLLVEDTFYAFRRIAVSVGNLSFLIPSVSLSGSNHRNKLRTTHSTGDSGVDHRLKDIIIPLNARRVIDNILGQGICRLLASLRKDRHRYPVLALK